MHCSGKPEKLLLIAAVYMRLDQGLCVKNGCPRHEQQAAVLAGLKEKKKTGHINEGMFRFLINLFLSEQQPSSRKSLGHVASFSSTVGF